jgi:hypothetical protein
LVVSGPPLSTRQDVKEIRKIGETIKLICPVDGFPEPIYEWWKVKLDKKAIE